jgi:hypothetical protein
LKNGQSYIQFITKKVPFSSIEGQYTLRSSDKKYHSITYEIPIDDFDYNGVAVREYEISSPETFFKTGTLRLLTKGEFMDVKYFINSNGFHVGNLLKKGPPLTPLPTISDVPAPPPVAPPAPQPASDVTVNTGDISFTTSINSQPTQASSPARNRPVRNQRRANQQTTPLNPRALNPSFSRPDLLTGSRSVQPGK